jgi:hypothetical protein
MRTVAVMVCAGLLVLGTVLHGRATHRWDALAPASSRLESLHSLRLNLGESDSKEIPSEFDPNEKSRVTCRQYFPAGPNDPIVVSLTTGIAGSVSTHTPDVCYVGSGYRMTKAPTRQTVEWPGGGSASYYVADFEKKRATGVDRQRVRWAWTTDGTWLAPASPRFAFLRAPELAKVYVVTTVPESLPDDGPDVKSRIALVFAQYSAALAR